MATSQINPDQKSTSLSEENDTAKKNGFCSNNPNQVGHGNNTIIDKFLKELCLEFDKYYEKSYNCLRNSEIKYIPEGFNADGLYLIYKEKLHQDFPLVDEYKTNDRVFVENYLWDLFYYDKSDKYEQNLKINLDKFNHLVNRDDRYPKVFSNNFYKYCHFRDIKIIAQTFKNENDFIRHPNYIFAKEILEVEILIKSDDANALEHLIEKSLIQSLISYINEAIKKYDYFSIGVKNVNIVSFFSFNMSNSEIMRRYLKEHNLKGIFKKNSVRFFKKKNPIINFFYKL